MLSFATLWWNNQTTVPESQGYEVLVNGSWVLANAAISDTSAVTVMIPSTLVGTIQGIRYAWAEIPTSQQLFDGGTAGLPAMPFIALCDETSCTLVPPGSVSDYGPPGPPPPAPPAPPAPPSEACTFTNSSTIGAVTPMAQLEVKFLDAAACCGACEAYPECASAEMFGSGTKHPPFKTSLCALYRGVGIQKSFHCDFPCARVAIVPQ